MHLHRHRGCPTMTTRTSKAKHTNRCMSPTKFTLVAFVACTLLFTASQQFMLIMPPPSNLRIVPKDIDGTVGSQADNNVDKLISHKLFKKDFAGTFVEFGCSNGIRNSNSLLLEREYGWNGLCIEPNPFEAKFAIKNRKHGIHALISYPAQDYKYAAMSGHCAQGSGIVEFMNEKSKNNLKTCPKARGEQLNYVTIPGVKLETLLDEKHMPSVTWISADCEGCEWTFIQNFDFDKYDVRVFSYETSANQATGTKIEHLLTEKGFSKHIWKGNDVVYVRNMHRNTPQNTPISVDDPDQEMPPASNLRIVPKNIDGTVGSQADRNSPALGKTISYSLYGSNPRYTDGAIDNAKLMKEIYPDWTMRVYYDTSVPLHILQKLKDADVELVDMSNSTMNKMSWRFLAAIDGKRFCARDIDSRLSKRESAAVEEWLQSDKQFHVMRDHPSHSKYPMSGGMWCSTTIPDMKDLITKNSEVTVSLLGQFVNFIRTLFNQANQANQAYLVDMDFLNKVIWPMAQKSLLQHDPFSCDKFGGGKPFPTPRIGGEHVGGVFINGHLRGPDVDILKTNCRYIKCGKCTSSISKSPDFITNKKYIAMCDVSYKTRSKNDLILPLKPNTVVCAKGDTATLTEFFKLDIQVPFTLVTIEMDDATPQNTKWLDHKHLKKWYSWNSKHPGVIPIPIGLNEDSQLVPMAQAKLVEPKIEKILINFKQNRKERTQLFNQVKDLPYVHVEPYSKKWQNAQEMTLHYESISKYKWTLCPRGAGEDTHRLWEALYLGSIPVVLKSSLSALYKGLPVIELDNWNELSLDTLKKLEKKLPSDRSNANFQHWVNTIRVPKTVVIAAALNYGIATFTNFIVPLRKVYTGDVVLFVKADLPKNVVALCNKHAITTKALPTGSRLSVRGNRYIGYAEECAGYDLCFATDFRDVFFQSDPFANVPADVDLVLTKEHKHVKIGFKKGQPVCTPSMSGSCTCPVNSEWINTCWGNEFLASIAEETPICSGTIMGTPKGFEELKIIMLEEMERSSSTEGCSARDQGHLNYVYYSNKFSVPIKMQSQGEGIVNTVGYITPRSSIVDHLNGEGLVTNYDQGVSAVVHQYDRFPELNVLVKKLSNQSWYHYIYNFLRYLW